jgi:multidrug resistance efflux pump
MPTDNMATSKETVAYEEDFTRKTANRRISKPMVIAAAIVILLAGFGIAGYFLYQGEFYYQTDNAKVDAEVFQLTANASGKVVKMNAQQGQQVLAGQVLARVNNGPDIVSPVDGTVTDVRMDEGDYANASDVLVVVAKTSDVYITANVEETNILKIRRGQNVSVSLDAYGRSFDGYVDSVSTVTSSKLTGAVASFTTSGTYTKVTQLLPVKIKLRDDIDLTRIIGTNAAIKIKIK